MSAVFLKLLNMSIAASWLIVAVVVLRVLLRKAPKAIRCVMWALVGVRLVCPFSFESVLSLIPSAETFPQKVLSGPSFDVTTGIRGIDASVNGYLGEHSFEGIAVPGNSGGDFMTLLGWIWIAGAAVLLLYALFSYLKLRKNVSEGMKLRDNIWLCDRIGTPFILGIIRPRIFLPSAMDERQIGYVVAHETAHLKRRDHWWKPLGFLLLSIYWFHPLCWAAYGLLCRDIELACDEKVVKHLAEQNKKAYSEALLACSVTRRAIAACPLAFSEGDVKKRIQAVLKYSKPAFWIVVAAVAACIVVAACFLTNPVEPKFDFGINGIVSAAAFDKREGSSEPEKRTLNEAQIQELISRLDGISGARRSDRYAGLTPWYSISAEQSDGTWMQISGYGLDGDMTDLVYNEKRYRITDTDFNAYVSRICAGNDTGQADETNGDDALSLILSFENYSNIYVYEAEEKDCDKPEKSFGDVVSQYSWRITGTGLGGLANDPEATIILTRQDGMQLFVWGDADVVLITDGTETGATAVSCGESIISELLPWAKARYAELLASVPVVSTEDIPGFITVLPDFNWSAYVKANGEQSSADLTAAFYTYIAGHALDRTQYSQVMQGTNGLDGASSELFADIIDILMERDPYTVVWCYDRLAAEKQAAVLPYIVWAYTPASSRAIVLAWMDDVREQLSVAEGIPLSADSGGETEFCFEMGGGVTLGLTTYSGGLPMSLSGFHGYHYEDYDGNRFFEASCNALGLVIRAEITSAGDYAPWEISVNTPAYPTVSGVAVGNAEKDIFSVYGDDLQRVEGEGNDKRYGHYDLRYVYAPEPESTITFYLYEGAVYLIIMEREIG